MRTIKKILVIFMLVVLAASIATAAISTKNTTKTVAKLGSIAGLNKYKSDATTENVTGIPTMAIVEPGANASVNNAKPPAKNTVKTITKSGSYASVNQSNALVPATVGSDLALHRHANQSSIYGDNQTYNASKGVDGSLATYFHTKNDSNSWWQVDLGESYPLSEVIIYNRQDLFRPDRARTLMVLLSNDSANWKPVYDNVKDNSGKIFGLKGEALTVDLKGEKARFVRLQLQEKNWFHLAEVEIYGVKNHSEPAVSNISLTNISKTKRMAL